MAGELALTPLGRLIAEVQDAEGVSSADIARRSNGEFHEGQISKWKYRQYTEALKPDTIRSLARALRRPAYQVWEAMGETLGIPQRPESEQRSRLSRAVEDPSFDELGPAQVHLVVSMASEMLPKGPSESRRNG